MSSTQVHQRVCALAFGILLSSGSADAGQIHVPADFASLQVAIDSAVVGDVIIVDGGTHGPLVIDKALTIVGVNSNPPFIRNALPGAVPPFSPVHLAGPGSGVVTLSKMVIGGTVDGAFFSLAHQGISGGGFDELRITHSEVDAPFWSNFTGIADGGTAIDVTVPLLIVNDSTVRGGTGTDDDTGLSVGVLPGAGIGIETTGDVIVHDSVVHGGRGFSVLIRDPALCPSSCDELTGGIGGDAIHADTVWVGGNFIAGGEGSIVICSRSGEECFFPFGQMIVAQDVVTLDPTMRTDGPLVLGQTWRLTYDVEPLIPVLLAVSVVPVPPIRIGEGLLFMEPSSIHLLSLPSAPFGSSFVNFTIPGSPQFIGITVVMQGFQPGFGLGSPLYATFVAP